VTWPGGTDTPLSARIAALAAALPPTERRVADRLVADASAAVDCTAQELADLAGVSRASVIRTAQTLGYDGYPQMRVAVAREVALAAAHDDAAGDLGVLHRRLDQFARNLPRIMAAVTEEAAGQFVTALDRAERVVVVATGLSAPLGLDVAMRLGAAGRPAEFVPDTLAQQIAASTLSAGSACLVISGSGATQTSIEAAAAAREAGADVLAVTSFARAPLLEHATQALVVPPVNDSFSDELFHTSRAALTLVLEALVEMLAAQRDPTGMVVRSKTLTLIEKRISS
jgi:DNA-binding MurR/RpiR family transcriptional regulator